MNSLDRMKELIIILQEASKAYYAEDREIMSNFEYDKLYDELVKLEEETGTTLAGSPTGTVGFEAVDELPNQTHETPMLSFDDIFNSEEIEMFNNLIDSYENQKIPFSTLGVVIRMYATRFNDKEILNQTFFSPYPENLINITDSGKGRKL